MSGLTGPRAVWINHLADMLTPRGVVVETRRARRNGSWKVRVNGGPWQDVAPATRALERLAYGRENP